MFVIVACSLSTGAVLSHFKSRQRVWRETTKPEQAERVALQSKQRRKRSRQARVNSTTFGLTLILSFLTIFIVVQTPWQDGECRNREREVQHVIIRLHVRRVEL